jgi:hypothetical protein
MTTELNRICPYCGEKMFWDTYSNKPKRPTSITYCDNDNCPVKPCTDATNPSRVYAEILAITGDKE